MSGGLAWREPALAERARTALTIVGLRSGAIAAKFGITLFIAHFLDLEALGLYGLVAGAAVFVPVLAGLGIIGVLGRAAVGKELRAVTAALVPYWSLVGALYLAAAAVGLPLAYALGHAALALLIGPILLVEHLNADVLVVLNLRGRPRLANLLLSVRTVAWIGGYVGLASFVPGLRSLPVLLAFWLAGAVAALLGFAFACRDWPWRAALRAPRAGARLRGLVRASRTLYLNDLANTGGQYADRYIVGAVLGLERAGVYFLFWSLANALSNVVNTSLLQVQQPAIILARSEPRRQRRLLGGLRTEAALVSLALGASTAALAALALAWFPRPGFAGQGLVLLALLAGFVLRTLYEVEGIGFYSRHEDGNTLFSGLIVLALSLAVTVTLTPVLGLLGPALAVVGSYLVGGLWRWRRNRSVFAAGPGSAPRGLEC